MKPSAAAPAEDAELTDLAGRVANCSLDFDRDGGGSASLRGDLQIGHVFVDREEITSVIDWSEAGQGDGLYDLASLTLGHEEHLGDVIAGYGTDVDLDVIRAWWSLRSLLAAR